jgi:cyclase
MLRNRIIPVLLHGRDGLVKTRNFKNPVYIGDPINAVRIFNQKQVDEIVILDIDRSKRSLGPDFQLVQKIASECFMPLSYGGGIRDLEDAKKIYSLGVEKIVIQSAAIRNPGLIRQVANFTGSQSISVSIDVLQSGPSNYNLYHPASSKIIDKPLLDYIRQVQEEGAGEIMITSVAHEGDMKGYNLDLIRLVRDSTSVPIIAHGGAGSVNDFASAISAGADAVAAGSFFVFYGPRRGVLITYPNYSELEQAIGESHGL